MPLPLKMPSAGVIVPILPFVNAGGLASGRTRGRLPVPQSPRSGRQEVAHGVSRGYRAPNNGEPPFAYPAASPPRSVWQAATPSPVQRLRLLTNQPVCNKK